MNTTDKTELLAKKVYEEYLEEGLAMFPPFKGYGVKLVQFAVDEPELYKALFWKGRELSYQDYLEEQVEWERLLPSIQATFDLNEEESRWLLKNIWFYAHGMASLFVTSSCVMSMEDINKSLGSVCRGLVMQLKVPGDERIGMNPRIGAQASGSITDYIKGKKNVIVGYGPKKEMYQIRLDAILYFEAVGENVFAYTKNNVYEIRMRLYKVEEQVAGGCFVRAAKALLVNTRRIASVNSDGGGRGRLVMVNGETIIASRSYYKDVLASIKNTQL